MKKLIYATLLLLWATVSLATDTSSKRDVEAFRAIDIKGPYQVAITAGQPQDITITGDSDLSQIITQVKDHTLFIYSATNTTKPINIKINLPKLQGLTLTGSNKIKATDLAGQEFSVSASGSSQLELQGTIHTFNLNLSGTTNVDAKNLTAKIIMLDASGSAVIAVRTNNELNVKANGDVVVKMYSTPRILTTSLSGNSKLQVAN